MILICDIDGVLADNTHRLKYMKKKDYKKFYSEKEVLKDELIGVGNDLFRGLRSRCDTIVLLTGRNETCREATLEWLITNRIPFDFIVFRDKDDWKPSPIWKKERVKEFLRFQNPKSNVIFVDDDPENVRAVSSLSDRITGITFGTSRFSV